MMKLQVSRNELLQTLQSVVGVVERRQTLPILSNFLMTVQDDQLTVTGTDLEMELVARARVQNLSPGKISVPARKLFDICRGLAEGSEVTLELSDDRMMVRSGRSRFTLATLRADEFPSFGVASGSVRVVRLTHREFKGLIERTQFAMAQQDVRYYLNGLLLDVHPKRVRAVATDGHRLAFSEVQRETGVPEAFQVILPRKSVQELSRVLTHAEDEVQLQIATGQVQVELDGVRLSTKTIDGRFPDYERVIPENSDKHVTCEREGFRRALARTAILSNEKFRGVRLQLASGELKLQTHNPEHEEAEEEIEVAYDGSSLEIGFNVNYLMDALGALDSAKIVMELKNADSSGLLYAEGDRSSRYVIMPMRL